MKNKTASELIFPEKLLEVLRKCLALHLSRPRYRSNRTDHSHVLCGPEVTVSRQDIWAQCHLVLNKWHCHSFLRQVSSELRSRGKAEIESKTEILTVWLQVNLFTFSGYCCTLWSKKMKNPKWNKIQGRRHLDCSFVM